MSKVKIEKLVHGGQGLGYFNGKPWFVWNALPGEEVEANIVRNKKDYIEGISTEILESSPSRIPATEEHYLSCSPWSILSYDQENFWKKSIALETYNYSGNLNIQDLEIAYPDEQSGYRNKMEYSFVWDEEGNWHLGFFQRGSHRKTPIDLCCLADPLINDTAAAVLALIQKINPPIKTLKSLILRTNRREVIVGIFVKDELAFDYSQLQQINCYGLKVYYSRPQSPASTTDKLLYSQGAEEISTTLLGHQLHYGLMSFFQVNEPIVEQAFQDIGNFLDQDNIVDYFSGVGAISIALQDKVNSAILVESNSEATEFAQKNIVSSQLQDRYQAICLPAEKATEYITGDRTIVFDPPRAGLHTDTIQTILRTQPSKIIYLSCNIITQSRDIALLKEKYAVKFVKIYNFFPRTPHIEGLVMLKLKS